MPASQPVDSAALRFAPRILFLSQSPDVVARGLAGEPLTLAQARAAARRRLDRRDHAGADPHALRRQARPLSVHRLQGRRRAADRRRRGARRRLRGDGGRQALRQGLVARAQPGGREARRHPAGHRRELRAHLPPERRQHRPVHLDRLRPGRAHRGAARRSRSRSSCAGRDALAAAILRSGGLLRFGQRCDARRRAGAGRAGDARRARCSRRSSRATRSPPS